MVSLSIMSKMKDRSAVRTYDEEGFVKRAACICVNDNESEVLLVSSRNDSQLWIVPGGGVEPDELPDMAAIREVREEAGVCGSLGRCLGVFENAERGHRTSVYVLVVTKELEEWDESRNLGRKRKWFSLEDAVKHLAKHKPVQSSYVSLLLRRDDGSAPTLPIPTESEEKDNNEPSTHEEGVPQSDHLIERKESSDNFSNGSQD
ncbi:UNVERIFIED_CONTAM: hypothetical protein RMT77_010598 [Armadillidium vulgare]|nr:Diphosphoinositol polyphosphate phosphohydrolase 1 [Armadillidium vulgare]